MAPGRIGERGASAAFSFSIVSSRWSPAIDHNRRRLLGTHPSAAPHLTRLGAEQAPPQHLGTQERRPSHLFVLMRSFATFLRKLSLQGLRQKRRPQWEWWIRPNFPPQ